VKAKTHHLRGKVSKPKSVPVIVVCGLVGHRGLNVTHHVAPMPLVLDPEIATVPKAYPKKNAAAKENQRNPSAATYLLVKTLVVSGAAGLSVTLIAAQENKLESELVRIVQTAKSHRTENVPKRNRHHAPRNPLVAGLNGATGPNATLTAKKVNELDLDFVTAATSQTAPKRKKNAQVRILRKSHVTRIFHAKAPLVTLLTGLHGAIVKLHQLVMFALTQPAPEIEIAHVTVAMVRWPKQKTVLLTTAVKQENV
jgi:hypothetical protein